MNNKISPFYVGQQVVAVRDGRHGGFKKGDVRTVLALQFIHCSWAVDVGDISSTGRQLCGCRCTRYETNALWAAPDAFAPLTSTFQAITFTEIMETELTSVN